MQFNAKCSGVQSSEEMSHVCDRDQVVHGVPRRDLLRFSAAPHFIDGPQTGPRL